MSTITLFTRIRYFRYKFKAWHLVIPLMIGWLISLFYLGAPYKEPVYVYNQAPVFEQKFDFSGARTIDEVETIYMDFYGQYAPLNAQKSNPKFVNQVSAVAWGFHKTVVDDALNRLVTMDNHEASTLFKTLNDAKDQMSDEKRAFQNDPTFGTKMLLIPYLEGGFTIKSKDDIEAYFSFLKDSSRMYQELNARVEMEMARPEYKAGVVLRDSPENHQIQKQTLAVMNAMEMSLGVFDSSLQSMNLTDEDRQFYFDQMIMIIGGELYTNVRATHDTFMDLDRHSKFE